MSQDNKFQNSCPVADKVDYYYDEQGNAAGSAENYSTDDWNDGPPAENGQGREGAISSEKLPLYRIAAKQCCGQESVVPTEESDFVEP